MRILIVDDEQEILNMLRRNLALDGYDVYTSTSPNEALEMMKDGLYNLVITDIKMPGMSGVDLLVEIKKVNPLANVIMMTGYSSMAHVVDCLGAGAMDYFVKPFHDLDEVISAVGQARDRILRWRSSMGLDTVGEA
jgi:DNA-binding NtrC family response regulator